MSYFKEISENTTYSGKEADFHFTYNENSGGGQAFLGGRFLNEAGTLTSPETINGLTAVFKCIYKTEDGNEVTIILGDEKAKYDIKPRGNGSTSMKLGIGNDRVTPSRIISAFMMLPLTCGVKRPNNLSLSILSTNNYWLQSMWLECDINALNEAELIPLDFVFAGGIDKDTNGTKRYFELETNKRILDIIKVSELKNVYPVDITELLKIFSDIYTGQREFQYDLCNDTVTKLMNQLAQEYPLEYSGITDPLPALIRIAKAKNEKSYYDDFEEQNREMFREWMSRQVKPQGDFDAGNPYEESSINAYVDVISRQIINFDGEERSLFATVDYNIVNRVVEDEVQKPDITNERRVSALCKYRAYVAETRVDSSENEYEKAARIINDYVLETGFEFEKSEDELKNILSEFNAKYSPEKLMAYSDDELMKMMFYTAEQTNDSMCYWLEFQKDCRSQFGSVTGGTSLKFGLYQNKEGEWITGSPAKKEIIPFDEAVQIGKCIRDKLSRGVEIIESSTLNDVADYEELHDKLVDALGNFATNNWVHKYFYMMFPDKFATWYSEDWQKHGLRGLLINPSSKTYGRSGQIAIVAKYAGLMAAHLGEAFYEKFGGIKQFCRLGTSDHDGNYAEDWRKQHIAAIGWPAVGSLENYLQSNGYSGKDIVKKALTEKMQEEYYPDDAGIASRKAGELQTFYKTTKDSIFVMMEGEKLLALCDDVGNYTYNENNAHMPHNKSVTWHCCFDEEERLPKKAEGHMTSCVELKDDENLLYLYKKYYYDLSEESEEEMPKIKPETEEYIEPIYNTGFKCDFERNRIVFGAPGTGKSYKLKQESEKLLGCAENHMERVTFHTDYSYSQFVGSYKPVTDTGGNIRYDFVPGPFMRVYVNAVKNTQQIMKAYEAIKQADTMYMFPTNPANENEKWDLFKEITNVNQVETFHAPKEAKVGDLALIYVANTKSSYENGIYAIGKIISKSEDIVTIQFNYVSYYRPIVDYKKLKEFNPNIRSTGRVSDKIKELIKDTIIPANPYLLLIEEINRAKVAAVFGDVFQLLDRDDNGVSEYEIQTSEDVRKYLASQLGGVPEDWLKIKLPDNMFIWASMNSADQGVFPMDTAFKRRWSFEYLGINENEKQIEGMIQLGDDPEPIEWNILRKAINNKLSKQYKVNEDKLMGPFFLSKKVLKTDKEGMIEDTEGFIRTFKSKVIMYLYEDAAKQHKYKLFEGCDNSKYSSVCDAFDKIGIKIFGDNFKADYYNNQEG